MSSVYVALVEVVPSDAGVLDRAAVAGAIVRCYVKAASPAAAEQDIRGALENDGLGVVGVEWCVDYGATDWEHPDSAAAAECVESAQQTNEVVYSEFHTWGHD